MRNTDPFPRNRSRDGEMFFKLGLPGPNGDGRSAYLNDDGVFLGQGTPLLTQRTDTYGRPVWQPRPFEEIETIVRNAYGPTPPMSVRDLRTWLTYIALHLTKGEFKAAANHLSLMRLPPLASDEVAARVRQNDFVWFPGFPSLGEMHKAGFNPDQPRDWHGRWTSGMFGGGSGGDWLPDFGGQHASIPDYTSFKRDKAGKSWADRNGDYPGECVSLPKQGIPGLPPTSKWRPGQRLSPKGPPLPPGTVIATFPDDEHYRGHAAIIDSPLYDGDHNLIGYRFFEQYKDKPAHIKEHYFGDTYKNNDPRKYSTIVIPR
ncbi:MAG: BPSL0067 family protein [Alphaproteobacteria bacterium]